MARTILITFIGIVLFSKCSKDKLIDFELNIEANKETAVVGTFVSLTCNSKIYHSKNLRFSWSCEEGEFGLLSNNQFKVVNDLSSNTVIWHAPFHEGNYQIICNVIDSVNNAENISIDINVYRPSYNNISTLYNSKRLISDIELINKDSVCTFDISFYNSEINIKLLKDELLLVSPDLNKLLITSLFDNAYFYSNLWVSDTIEGRIGKRPTNLQIKLEYLNDFLYVTSFFNGWHVKKVNLERQYVYSIPWFNGHRILDIESNKKGELFLITSPKYDSNQEISVLPKIWKLSDFGEFDLVFEFPANYDYRGANYGDGYPLSIKYDMAFDSENNLFIAMPYTEKIFCLDTNYNFSVFIDDIFCPASIEIAENGFMYIISSPEYININNSWENVKPLEILQTDEQGNRTVIKEIQIDYLKIGGSLRKMQNGTSYLLSSSIQNNILLNTAFEIYFIDSRDGSIKIIN